MKQPITWPELHEALMGAMDIGAQRATVQTLVAIAEAAGVTRIQGVSVRAFYHRAAMEETEHAISDIADDCPELATVVKRRWDEIVVKDEETAQDHFPKSDYRSFPRTRVRAREESRD